MSSTPIIPPAKDPENSTLGIGVVKNTTNSSNNNASNSWEEDTSMEVENTPQAPGNFQPKLPHPIPPLNIPPTKPLDQYSVNFRRGSTEVQDLPESRKKRKTVRNAEASTDTYWVQQIQNLNNNSPNDNPIGWLDAVGTLTQIITTGIDNITSDQAYHQSIHKEKSRIEQITDTLLSAANKLRVAAGLSKGVAVEKSQSSLDAKLTALNSKVDALSKALTTTGTKSYASAAANGSPRPGQPNAPTRPPSNKTEPTKPLHRNRFVVRYKGNPPPPIERVRSEDAVKRLNPRIAKEVGDTQQTEVLAAMLKPNGNYVVTFTNDIPPALDHTIKLAIKEELARDHPTAEVSRDMPWTKVIVHNISVTDGDGVARSMDSISAALKKNPILKNITLTQEPRWIHPPERMAGKSASAVSFAFEDDGSVLRHITKHNLYLFGMLSRVERWNERPKNAQCKKCYSVKHNTANCPRTTTTCRVCGKAGALERDHKDHCEECKKTSYTGPKCPHMCCVNCHQQDHCADDPRCPKLQKAGPRAKSKSPTQSQATSQ